MVFMFLLLVTCALATINLGNTPTWTSGAPAFYSTGGAWADMDGNGYLDLVVSNGNDMQANSNAVYYNSGGTLATTPAWLSADVTYHGHCDIADFNRDGYLDFAAAGFGSSGGSTPGVDRVYINSSTGLNTIAGWVSANQDYSFSVAWGDYDGDGDLDLAVASGWDYPPTTIMYPFKVYRNNGGTLSDTPFWQSASSYFGMDVEWADINSDGLLDLVGACSGSDQHDLVFLNTGSGLSTTPSWQSGDTGRTIQLAAGDFDNDGYLDLAAADNAQLGGTSFVKVYRNINGTLESTPSWQCNSGRFFYSCVAWADCDQDGYAELASGGWWEPAVVFENTHGSLNPTPTWQWITPNPNNLVCETVVWGDMDHSSRTDVTDETHTGNGSAKCFYVNHRPTERITQVKINDVVQATNTYCWHPQGGWVSFANAPTNGATVKISYTYDKSPDLAVTNWANTDHNYVFANQGNTGVELAYFGAKPDDKAGVRISWACQTEEVSGFQLWRRRSDGTDLRWSKVNDTLITGSSPYQYNDLNVKTGCVWQYALEAISYDGSKERFGPVEVDTSGLKLALSLGLPSPNPASRVVRLGYSLTTRPATLCVYDIAGRLVQRWELTQVTSAGSVNWDLVDSNGMRVANGVYLLRLGDGVESFHQRLVVSH